ncbi:MULTISPECIES: NnrS family protein [unclassified Luteimonas]|uniref:NnrS family protein n=1 Tax=unclassified Luteimonas TaxID=2629088 RepID=UPI0018F0681A|nr:MULTISPECIES: NnrS family protein [unclassified Luteimonas]MBJ6977855.1 NnrS family protein [Luteimonas sp. MC1895]MBJ6984674.1 NnrS family protein [Luteimonas sp. MC1750]QQO04728.1 NnrS family protein [Luteimonas sp. MC1750]
MATGMGHGRHGGASAPFVQLAAAPHRLMFFVGTGNVLLAMAWWTAWLVANRWPGVLAMPQPEPYAGWLHAIVMQYQMLPSFIFGFLLTTFPRWMGLPDAARWHYVPVGLGMFGGQIAVLLGALGAPAGIEVGVAMTLAGWMAGLFFLGDLVLRDRNRTWHARSCFAALVLGWVGLAAFGAALLGGAPTWIFASIKIGTFGLLLPVYLTVAHRMFPFFAANVVAGYVSWRPLWLLAAFWALCMLHLGLELMHAYAWLWVADLPLLALSLLAVWRWWPRGPKPGILAVLFIGLGWLPVTFALYSAQSLAWLAGEGFILGRAPAHALFVGFFGSLLVAMVTRVTQGHSGRRIEMPGVAWFAFAAIQLVTVVRILADVSADAGFWWAVAAFGWLVALAPWAIRLGRIYLIPRADGKPG